MLRNDDMIHIFTTLRITYCVLLPSENSSVEVTESRLCWSLLSESLRTGKGPAHAPPGCSLAHDDEEEENEGGA